MRLELRSQLASRLTAGDPEQGGESVSGPSARPGKRERGVLGVEQRIDQRTVPRRLDHPVLRSELARVLPNPNPLAAALDRGPDTPIVVENDGPPVSWPSRAWGSAR